MRIDDINDKAAEMIKQNEQIISDEEIDKFISSFPYTKHLDDGQFNDGVISGIEIGIEWYKEQLKLKQ